MGRRDTRGAVDTPAEHIGAPLPFVAKALAVYALATAAAQTANTALTVGRAAFWLRRSPYEVLAVGAAATYALLVVSSVVGFVCRREWGRKLLLLTLWVGYVERLTGPIRFHHTGWLAFHAENELLRDFAGGALQTLFMASYLGGKAVKRAMAGQTPTELQAVATGPGKQAAARLSLLADATPVLIAFALVQSLGMAVHAPTAIGAAAGSGPVKAIHIVPALACLGYLVITVVSAPALYWGMGLGRKSFIAGFCLAFVAVVAGDGVMLLSIQSLRTGHNYWHALCRAVVSSLWLFFLVSYVCRATSRDRLKDHPTAR